MLNYVTIHSNYVARLSNYVTSHLNYVIQSLSNLVTSHSNYVSSHTYVSSLIRRLPEASKSRYKSLELRHLLSLS